MPFLFIDDAQLDDDWPALKSSESCVSTPSALSAKAASKPSAELSECDIAKRLRCASPFTGLGFSLSVFICPLCGVMTTSHRSLIRHIVLSVPRISEASVHDASEVSLLDVAVIHVTGAVAERGWIMECDGGADSGRPALFRRDCTIIGTVAAAASKPPQLFNTEDMHVALHAGDPTFKVRCLHCDAELSRWMLRLHLLRVYAGSRWPKVVEWLQGASNMAALDGDRHASQLHDWQLMSLIKESTEGPVGVVRVAEHTPVILTLKASKDCLTVRWINSQRNPEEVTLSELYDKLGFREGTIFALDSAGATDEALRVWVMKPERRSNESHECCICGHVSKERSNLVQHLIRELAKGQGYKPSSMKQEEALQLLRRHRGKLKFTSSDHAHELLGQWV